MSRLSWAAATRELTRRLSEPAPGCVQLVTAPRQAGKTSLLRAVAGPFGQVVVHARGDVTSRQAVPALADAWGMAERLARRHGRALLAIDDVHFVKGWQPWLAGAWARARASALPLHLVLTASCALDRALDSQRCKWLERLTMSGWSAGAIVETGALDRLSAADHVVSAGACHPSALRSWQDRDGRVESLLVRPALDWDLPSVTSVRKPRLLRPLLDACLASATQVMSLGALRAASGGQASLETIGHYLELLEAGGLVALLPELGRDRGWPRDARYRILPRDNALLSIAEAGDIAACRGIDGSPSGPDAFFPRRVRNACLAHACSTRRCAGFWREGKLEVDAVIDDGRGRQLLVVRPGPVGEAELEGAIELCGRMPSYEPVLVGDSQGRPAADAADVDWVDWREFLLVE